MSGLVRRTPLARTGGPLRRSRLRPISAKKAAGRDREAEVRAAVFERDGGCLLSGYGVGPCLGRLTFHHLLKASQGGAYTEANGVALCVHHNGWVEDAPAVAWALGLVVRAGDPPALAAERRAARGLPPGPIL